MIHEDDILEYCLNNGIDYTASKFNMSKNEIFKIVLKFSRETCLQGNHCSCERMAEQGIYWSGCDGCDKGLNTRINIRL